MKTKDAPYVNIFPAKNGLVVRVGHDMNSGRMETKDETLVFNDIPDLFSFLMSHFTHINDKVE